MRQYKIRYAGLWAMILVFSQLTACDNNSNGSGNQVPVATTQSVTLNEDSATAIILSGSDVDGTITAYTTVNNPSHGVLSGTSPNLTYTPDADFFGSDSFTFTVTDNEGANSVAASITIIVDPVNDAPSFVMGTYQGVNEDAGAQNIAAWASAISTGPSNESGQIASFIVSNDNNALFSVQPSITSDGTLSYTPAANAFGSAAVSVQLQDDGGTANGGTDSIAAQTFSITINPVNDALSVSTTGLPASNGDTVQAAIVTDNFSGTGLQYAWQASGSWAISGGQGTSLLDMLAPASSSGDSVSLSATSSTGPNLTAALPLGLSGDNTPILQSLSFTPQSGTNTWQLGLSASDPNLLTLNYNWTSGGLPIANSASAPWTPSLPGQYRVSVNVSNGSQSTSGSMEYFHVSTAPWPFFRGTRQGTGARFPIDTSTNSGQQKWRTPFTTANCTVIKNFVSGVAQAKDGTLYVGSWDEGKLFAINPDNGEVNWFFTTAGGAIHGSPAIGYNGTIYVAEHDTGTVYAINPDGTEQWSFATGAVVSSPIALDADGTLYVGTDNGAASELYALNVNGTEKWSSPFALAAETRSSVNFGADVTVYARDYAGYLYAINPADGSPVWSPQPQVGGGSGSSPVVAADGTIYFGSFSSPPRLYAMNPDGSQKWVSDMGGASIVGIGATPAVAKDGTVYVGTWDTGGLGSIYALNPTDGGVIWGRQLDDQIQSASIAVGADGTVFTASARGILYALDPSTGVDKWTYDLQAATNEESPSPLTIGADGTIYTYTCDGALHAIE